ncbi:hypothetical protein HYV85_01625 [Candidatus Woesearchaeota archaeon]|nr:hypothetical protein [Candidatus Woesearchaeota archaeon]
MPKAVFDDDVDLLGELESQEEDEGILEELAAKRRERRKNFISVVNRKKLSRHELDEVML